VFNQYVNAFILLGVAFAAAAGVIVMSHLLGRVTASRTRTSPYECGSVLIDKSRKRIAIKFYLVAMMFILFDIEAAYLYPWAVTFRQLGVAGFAEMMVFIFVLIVGYAFIWRRGAFTWE